MRRLDTLILRELIGPWLFGVAMFSALLIAATYLGRIADYIVQGVPASTVGELTILLLPAILVKTFAMASLLSALLAFGRLSSDSEIVALKANGATIYRIVAPVAVFSVLVAVVAFFFNESIVPQAALRSQAIMRDLAQKTKLKIQPTSRYQVRDGKVQALIAARDFSLQSGALRGVTIVAYDKTERESFVMFAKELVYRDEKTWRIQGGATVISADLRSRFEITDEVWPDQIPNISLTPTDLFTQTNNDLDTYSMAEIKRQIERSREDRAMTEDRIRNLEYGYWNKISLPLAALIFGILGAGLGVRNHRTGTAAGFALAIGIIFGYFTLANFMNVWAMGGVIPPYVASFTPIVLGLIASGIVMWRRNVA